MGLKNLYYAMEEKWYKLWDKVDTKIPVYGVIDRIDSVVPSFMLFLLIILFIVLFFGMTFYFSQRDYSATFNIYGFDGSTVSESKVGVTLLSNNGDTIADLSKFTDSEGTVVFENLSIGQEILLDINLSKGSFSGSFPISGKIEEDITLKKDIILAPVRRTIFLKNQLGLSVRDAVGLDLYCQNSSVTPNPANPTVTNGSIIVEEPINCVTLFARVNSDRYIEKSYPIRTTSYNLILEKYEPPKSSLKVRMRYNNAPISDTSFNVNLSGTQNYSVTTNNAEAVFNVLPGTYYLSISNPEGKYGVISKNIAVNENKIEVVNLTKNVIARIGVTVNDELSGNVLEGAIVTLKSSTERAIASENTGSDGKVSFAITDAGNYYVTAKLVGGMNEGYFAKTIFLENVNSDANVDLELEKITTRNAGRVLVRVLDQDGEPVANAKAMLKQEGSDTLIELNDTKNYGITDINGEVTLLAGKVDDKVYASAIKYPFTGISGVKRISLEEDNEFDVEMEIGNTTISINVTNDEGDNVDGEARLYFTNGDDATDLISIENGRGQIITKAGKTIYLAVRSENEENYYSEPRFLWPGITENFDVVMKTEINNTEINLEGIYNGSGTRIRSLQAGNSYYAILSMDSDQSYNEVLMHFRAGQEELLENDYIEIDNVEGAGIDIEIRGASYSPERGYAFDSENLTESLAKWVTVKWNNFGIGTRKIRVNFKVKNTTPPNQEVAFFWRAAFDNENLPISNAAEELYDAVYGPEIYFVGEEATCEDSFCIISEWMYDLSEGLYMSSPFVTEQANQYTYHFQILNNSEIDYGANKKDILLNLEMLSEENMGAKIIGYQVKEFGNEISGGAIQSISNLAINSFEKQTTIDVTLTLEGNLDGASILHTELRSDGEIIFVDEEAFSVPEAEDLFIILDRTFIPTLVNTEIVVTVLDDEGEPIIDSQVRTLIKEPGFEEYESDVAYTNRLGKTTIETGAHFPNTKVIIEVSKEDFARKRVSLSVSDEIIAFNPSSVSVNLNTATKREEILSVDIGNATGKELEIVDVTLISEMGDFINEGAFRAYLDSFIGETIDSDDSTELDLIRVRIANSLTEETYVEPINEEGEIAISFRIVGTSIIFDAVLPINVSISSDVTTGNDCIKVNSAVQTKSTQRGQVRFIFELLNACESEDGVLISLDELYASSSGDILGIAELALQSVSSSFGGRASLDGGKRKVYNTFRAGEKLIGTVTYVPSEQEIGTTVSIPIQITGKRSGVTVATDPTTLDFKVDVINLKDCLTISSDAGPIANEDSADVTVDATNCLDQKVEVFLCRNDGGCSGGVEGKINLSNNHFTIQKTSQTVQASSPSLPGSYGVSVWARVKGRGSYNYIGEVPVAFREPEGKYFNLNKFEVNIVGDEQEDIIQLTNYMLTQNVIVEADNCVWGVQDPETNWTQIMAGVMVGAQIGSMLGGALETDKFDRDGRDQDRDTDRTSGDSDGDSSGSGENGEGTAWDSDGDGISNYREELQTEINDLEASGKAAEANDLRNQMNSMDTIEDTINGDIINFKNSTAAQAGSHYFYTTENGDIISTDYQLEYFNNSMTYDGESVKYIGHMSVGYNYSTSTPIIDYQGIGSNGTFSNTTLAVDHMYSETSNTSGFTRSLYTWWNSPVNNTRSAGTQAIEKLPRVSFASWEFPGATPINTFIDSTLPKASFGWVKGTATVVGAIAGGLVAYLDQEVDCSDTTQTATYQDFVILLQGTEVGINAADGSETESTERTIVGDAGGLGFTLDQVGASWDFTNADYSSVEHAGIKFRNDGINEPRAKYGVLTINARTHNHGNQILVPSNTSSTGTTSDSSSSTIDEHDVTCLNANFGNFWIGPEEEAGECDSIIEGTHSQKYHIRVLSGDAADQEAYIKKARSCYNGVLTGSTGEDAMPKVSLEWDWDDIEMNSCDQGNPDYVYCDATQFTITMVKKLAILNDFFKVNSSIICPDDPGTSDALEQIEELNSVTELVSDGFIGVTDISVSVVDNEAIATVTVNNKTGATIETEISALWRGRGAPANDLIRQEFPVGESQIEFSGTVEEYDDLYFFIAIANSVKGNRRAVQRAFQNLPTDSSCWVQPTTRPQGGMPSIMYYLSEDDEIDWTDYIRNPTELNSYLRFRSYLMRDAYSEDFINDFKEYYLNTLLQISNASERTILENLSPNIFSVVKRYSNQSNVEAGLYDVYFYIDFGEDFTIINNRNDTSVETSLLLVKNPSTAYPLYNLPFNGLVGEIDRQGYGTSVSSETDGFGLELNENLTLLDSVSSNGVVEVRVTKDTSFERVNTNPGSRGQLASISVNGTTADIVFTPNYATPVIAKQIADGTLVTMAYDVEQEYTPINVGGNLNYWTGAAKSKDFFGMNATEIYYNSPDYLLDTEDYGFDWEDATSNNPLYLKTIFYTPVDKSHVLISNNSGTSFWSPNEEFAQLVELDGIAGMNNNSGGSYFETLDDLYSMVESGDVCISNDGSTMSFWWNPYVLENTSGTEDSLAEKEINLVGSAS
jgi:hypothetical protein